MVQSHLDPLQLTNFHVIFLTYMCDVGLYTHINS
jgi:hypothetical protein